MKRNNKIQLFPRQDKRNKIGDLKSRYTIDSFTQLYVIKKIKIR